MKNIIIINFMILFLFGCGGKEIIYFYSIDKTQCITVINQNNIRYIIQGKYSSIPKSNYIQLDIQNITPLSDALYIRWANASYQWEVVVPGSRIIVSTLDTLKFSFKTKLPLDGRNIPTAKKFRESGGAVFDFYSMTLWPNKGAIVEH